MALKVACPGCGAALALTDEMRGRQVACKKCGKLMMIPPAKSAKTDPNEQAVQRPPARRPAPLDDKKSRSAVSSAPLPKRERDDEPRSRRRDRDDDDEQRDRSPARKSRRRDEDDDDERPARRKSGVPMGLIIGGAAGAFVLVIGVVLAIVLFKQKEPILPEGQLVANKNEGQKNNADPSKDAPKDNSKKEAEQPPVKLPDDLNPDNIVRVKQATAFLKVTTPTGMQAEGSGFFAVEPGIVVTNAHVLGMLSPNSRPPKQVEVVVHSGLQNKVDLIGEVLGVDRTNDLAVVRVQGVGLPAPLKLELASKLIETQKVYIFGFPLGRELSTNQVLGPSVTVSTSSVSSLRTNATGALEQVQVNGGMHPGNSGGPVVNSLGNIVGVSVAGIRGTSINFAIPSDFVKLLLDGRILDSKYSDPYLSEGQARMPVRYTCLDPFGRIREFKVEVWTGNAGPERPLSLQQPQAMAGDGQRQQHTLRYENGFAIGEVPMPVLGPGQVAWLQPLLVTNAGSSQWGSAKHTEADLAPLERKPANLVLDFTKNLERTVHLKVSQSISIIKGKQKSESADRVELDFLEALHPAPPKGNAVKLNFAPPKVSYEENGRKLPIDPLVPDILRRIPPTFVVDPVNTLRERGAISLNPKLDFKIREFTNDYFNEICNAWEATNLIMPNRTMQPLETWDAVGAMLMKQERKMEVVDLVLGCTYEGTRMRKGRSEAFITVTGLVKGRGPTASKVDGKVTGKFAFDLAEGYIAQAKMTIASEADLLGGAAQMVAAFDMDLSRALGNPLNLEVPKQGEVKPNLPVVKGNVLMNSPGILGIQDPIDVEFKTRGSRAKRLPLNLEKGKKYSIQLDSEQFDAYLRLLDANGKVLAVDDDSGGGHNARIDFTPPESGSYGLVITSFDGKRGQFQLRVIQVAP